MKLVRSKLRALSNAIKYKLCEGSFTPLLLTHSVAASHPPTSAEAGTQERLSGENGLILKSFKRINWIGLRQHCHPPTTDQRRSRPCHPSRPAAAAATSNAKYVVNSSMYIERQMVVVGRLWWLGNRQRHTWNQSDPGWLCSANYLVWYTADNDRLPRPRPRAH